MVTEQQAIDGLSLYYRELDAAIPARPPAWRPERRRMWSPQSWRRQLVAIAALLLLAIGAGILIHEAQVLNRTNPVTTPSPQVRAYQSAVSSGVQGVAAASRTSCQTTQTTGCPEAITALRQAAQRWLSDLDRSTPPARFAPVAAELRRNLGVLIADLNAMELAVRADDQNALDRARDHGSDEDQLVQDEGYAIAHAYQGTAAAYRASVHRQVTTLNDCGLCQVVISQSNAQCTSDLQRCRTNVATAVTTVDEIQGELTHIYAPDSLAGTEKRLQSDLSAADSALAAMNAALNAKPNPAAADLTLAHQALVSALAQFVVDANGISD